MSEILQILAVSLPASVAPERLLAEIDRIQTQGDIRILDLLLVRKQQDGTVLPLSLDEDEDLGGLISRFVSTDGRDTELDSGVAQVRAQIQTIPVGTAVGFILVEHAWAHGVLQLLHQSEGAVLGAELLACDIATAISEELAQLDDVVVSIDIAQATEAEQRLSALETLAETGQVLAASDQIRAQAAAETLHTLTVAGIVETAAIHEALDTLSAAGLIGASAEQLAAREVAAATLIVAAVDETAAETVADDLAAVAVAEKKMTDATRAASVTPAEIRVLRYLPTTLSFALISHKLGISRGAAKMRAERLYEKLDVHSRAQAVERARSLRVLP